MTQVLALDVGSTFARAAAYDERGEPLGEPVRAMHGGVTDADELAALVARIADEARAGTGAPDAVAVSCFWHSLIALDRRDRPLTPILGWRETDAARDADALARRVDPAGAHRRTGCVLHPAYWPAKLARLARSDPDTFRAAARFASFAEYLLLRLVGEERMSLSSASGTGLLDHATGTWDSELLDVLGVSPERLPEVSDEPLGAHEPWYPALGDGACANVGAGCLTRERAALTVGTSAAYRTVFAAEHAEPRPGLFLYRLDAARFVEGGALSDGGNLYHWLRETLRLPDDAGLDDREPGAAEPVFLPLLGGERSPGWDARTRGAVAGLTFETTPLDLLHAGLEGVALRLAEIAERMPEVAEVVVTGGAMAASPAWVQLVADALERPVARTSVHEASARGAAVIALERLGERPPEPATGEVLEPRPERRAAVREARRRQRELREALRRRSVTGVRPAQNGQGGEE